MVVVVVVVLDVDEPSVGWGVVRAGMETPVLIEREGLEIGCMVGC